MKKLITLVALLTLGVLPVLAQKASAGKPYVSPEGKFSILFPGEPAKGVVPMESGGLKWDMYSFSVGVEVPVSFYQLHYFDLAALTEAPAGPFFDSLTKGFLQGTGGSRVVDQKDITVGGGPGRIVSVAGENGDFFKMKMLIVGTRSYQITVGFASGGKSFEETVRSSEPLADKFLNSFETSSK